MKLLFTLLITITLAANGWSQQLSSKYPSVQNLITNSDNCINIIVVGNGNLVNVNTITQQLEKLFRKLTKNEAVKKDQMLKKLDSILTSMKVLQKSYELGKAQFAATQYLDTLSQKYILADSLNAFQSEVRSLYTQTSSFPCDEGLQIIEVGGVKYYLTSEKDITKEELIIYETINESNRLLFKYKQKFGFLDSTWHIIIEPKYDTAYSFSESLAYVKRNYIGEYFINQNDSIVIDLSDSNFVYVSSFYDSVALVKITDDPQDLFQPRWNYIDKEGKFISKDHFFDADNFSFGLASVGNFIYTDDTTNNILTWPFIENVLEVRITQYLERSKRSLLHSFLSNYSRSLNFYRDLQVSTSSDRYWFRRQYSRKVPKSFFDLLDFAYQLSEKNYGFQNHDELMFLKTNYSVVQFFHSHRLLYGYIDNKGVFQIRPQFYWAEPFDFPNTARASIANVGNPNISSGVINREGKLKGTRVFPTSTTDYEFKMPISDFDGKFAFANNTLLDSSGQLLFHILIDSLKIVSVEKGLVKCKNHNSQFGLLTSNGVEIFPCKYKSVIIREDNLNEGVLVEVDQVLYLVTPLGKPIKLNSAHR